MSFQWVPAVGIGEQTNSSRRCRRNLATSDNSVLAVGTAQVDHRVETDTAATQEFAQDTLTSFE